MLKHRNACPANGFYTYYAFSGFGTTGDVITQKRGFGTTEDVITQKREIATFLAQTSHETTGGWASAPDGPYAWRWGFCYKQEQGNPRDYCVQSTQWPCAAGKKYYGRGPIHISYNYNYESAGQAINSDLLNNPDLVATDLTISFKTALWFWMTAQSPKPSCHSVAIDGWTSLAADQSASWVARYGLIINEGVECGHGSDNKVADMISFYKRYCDILGASYGVMGTRFRGPVLVSHLYCTGPVWHDQESCLPLCCLFS